jgi:ABC-type multidrug transport system fused ATPase/permease subunit
MDEEHPAANLRARVAAALREDRATTAAFAIGGGAQALAHASIAACAGALGEALAGDEILGGSARSLPLGLHATPVALCAVAVGAAVVKTVGGSISAYAQRRTASRVGDALRSHATCALLEGGRSSSAAEAAAVLAVRVRDVERGVDEGVLAHARALAQLVPLFGAMIAVSSRLALASLGALVPFALGLRLIRRRFRDGYGRAATLAEKLQCNVDELVRHVDLWRTFGAGAQVRAALAAAEDAAGRSLARADAGRAALSGANEALAALALLAAVSLAAAGVIRGGSGLVAFAAVFFLSYRPLRDLGDARTSERRGAEALAVVERAFEVDADAPAPAGRAPRTWAAERLDVRGVAAIRGDVATARASFIAEPGEVVAVVGPTGAGKTSLLRALLGLERSAGSITYGGVDLTAEGVGPANRPFAWVPQEPAVVAATLGENVALGAAARTSGATSPRAALDALGAQALVPRLDEPLEAGGPSLSGGERQWLSLARAIASGQPVLLLDEPTSGLDAASQARVIDALRALRDERAVTIVLVTHRPEPLAIADRVVRLGSELGEEARVVLEQELDVRDVELEHRRAIDAHAEGEAGVALGVDAAVAKDVRVDHPAAEHLEPAGALADAAALVEARLGVEAEDAADVELGARLDERKVARPEAHGRPRAVEPLGERREHALEVRERDALVHEEALDLVEHR